MRKLSTARLKLEPQLAEHADEMFSVLSDPAIYEHENEPPPSAAWLRARFRKLESRLSADGAEQWLNWVVRLAGGDLIGYVQATVRANSPTLVAYEFSSKFWGRGLAGEAVQAVIAELRAGYGVTDVGAVLKRTNSRSRRLLERLNFVERGYPASGSDSIEGDEFFMSQFHDASGVDAP